VPLLRSARPRDGILGEEDGLDIAGERQWLLDPLDGLERTTNVALVPDPD
jgi:fructose-1,6-bisphosphatase/inositol monophosphatase family enzyme